MDLKRLSIVLGRVRDFLQKYKEPDGSIIADLMSKFGGQPNRLKEEIRKLFGAMGSLTDIWISKVNGHQVEHEKEANLELSILLDVLWEEVKDPVRNRIPEYNQHLLKVRPTTHEQVQEAFGRDDLDDLEVIFDVLVWITYYDPDWRWVQQQCLDFTYHANPEVRSLAVTCLADLARLHRSLDGGIVLSRLGELMNDPEVQKRAEEALVDINSVLNIAS